MLPTLLYILGAFLLGAVPFALLLGRTRGVDLRSVGSRNVGATNLARTLGLGWGVAAFLLDAAKGFAPVWLVPSLVAGGWAEKVWFPALAGGVAVLGHCFSPFLRFKGGKGVATAVGALAALDPIVSGILLGVWGISLALVRNVGVSSSIAAVAGAGIGVFFLATGEKTVLAVILVLLAAVIVLRHRANLRDYYNKLRVEAPG